MTSSHNIRCYVIFPGVVLTEDVYIFKYAKKYLLCRPFRLIASSGRIQKISVPCSEPAIYNKLIPK